MRYAPAPHGLDAAPAWIDPLATGLVRPLVHDLFSHVPADVLCRDGRWLPGLTATLDSLGFASPQQAVCTSPCGVRIARGPALARAVGALAGEPPDPAYVPEPLLRMCASAGVWVASSLGLPEPLLRRWAALGVAPIQVRALLDAHPRYTLDLRCRVPGLVLRALGARLARYGLLRSDSAPGAWPLVILSGLEDPPPAVDPARPWALLCPTPVSLLAAAAPAGPGHACPTCTLRVLATGPWLGLFRALTLRAPWSDPFPGADVCREPARDPAAAARHVARTLALRCGTRLLAPPVDTTAPGSAESILADPQCPACAVSLPPDPPSVLDRPEDFLAPWSGLYAEHLAVDGYLPGIDGWAWRAYTSVSARSRASGARRGFVGRRDAAGGKGPSRRRAFVGAAAETVERVSAELPAPWLRHHRILRGTAADLRARGHHVLTPDVLQRHGRWLHDRALRINERGHVHCSLPLPFGPREDSSAVLEWVACRDMASPGEPDALVPADWAFFPLRRPLPPSPSYSDSNGLAAGPTFADAAARAFAELVERDAFALWWYRRARLRGVYLHGLGDPWLAESRRRLAAADRRLFTLDATTFGELPVVLAVTSLRRPLADGSVDTFVTAGCAPTLAAAARRAVSEQVQLMLAPDPCCSALGVLDPPELRAAARWRLEEHRWLLPDPGRTPVRRGGYPRATPCSGPAFLARCVALAPRIPTPFYLLDLTLERTGAASVRAIAPGLVHFWHRLGHPRLLRGHSSASGHRSGLRAPSSLNPVPVFL